MSQTEHFTDEQFAAVDLDPAWNRARLGLEHAVSGSCYWLTTELIFYLDQRQAHYLNLGPCQQEDPARITAFLEAQGFSQTGRRFMREWEYTEFRRGPPPDP